MESTQQKQREAVTAVKEIPPIIVTDGTTAVEQTPEIVHLHTESIVEKKRYLYRFVKRSFDVVVSLLCLTVGLPVWLLIALCIVIEDPGNPLFVQKRVGLNSKVFWMIKFRTMWRSGMGNETLMQKNECTEVHFKLTDDPRVTVVGRFLRRTSLDEITQLINVLLGDMSIIGPRPFIPSEQSQLPADRLSVKPGLSCYWQITDTTKMRIEDQLELDYKYIRESSCMTDLKLIWLTVKFVFKGNNK